MFKYTNAFTNRSGDALPGYFARLYDSSGNLVSIYADASETPISTVSGVANAALSDENGMFRWYVANGTYDMRFYDANDVFVSVETGVPMMEASGVYDDLASDAAGKGASLVVTEAGDTVEDALADKLSASALAADTGAAAVGTSDGSDVQAKIDLLTAPATLVTRGPATGDTLNERSNQTIGINALAANTFVADGYAAGGGFFYDQGSWNVAIGDYALESNTTGHRNIAIGREALTDVTTGYYNMGIGVWAGWKLTTGVSNIYIGTQAGQNATTGSHNTGVGVSALNSLTTGEQNTALGHASLQALTTANFNTAVGRQSGLAITTGADNTIVGYQAGSALTTSNFNTVMGSAALGACVTGQENAAFGRRALLTATGNYNTAVGCDAGVSVTSGTQNTFIGYSAASSTTTGTNNIVIGHNAQPSSASVNDEVTFGNANVGRLRLGAGTFDVSATNLILSNTATAGGTTGARTINKPAGSVNFAAAATSLVVTNSLVTAASIIIATVATNDSTMKSVVAVAGSGSFTLTANAAATAETRVSFLVIN